MLALTLAWTLLTTALWTTASSQSLLQEQVKVLYPKLWDNETLDCECGQLSCDQVLWFRTLSHSDRVEFIGKGNQADRVIYGKGFTEPRFKIRKRGSSTYSLRIVEVTQDDTGTYSCVLKEKNEEILRPGVLLLPGVTMPSLTQRPKTKAPPSAKPRCPCPKPKQGRQDGCGHLVLWPLVGLIGGLSLALICTLYYFSRLPKKCRHHFVKKN